MNFYPFNSTLAWINRSFFALLIGLLASCASIMPGDQYPRAGEQAVSASLTYQETVTMAGRLSIRYQANGSEQALHGSFTWAQQPGRTLVSLLSPLGQTLAIIESTPAETNLRQPGQPLRTARDVDQLTAQALGWPLPVAGLRHWLQGFAMDAGGLRVIASPDSNAMPQTSLQDGWKLHYASWNQDAVPPHPKRLDLQRTTQQAGDVEIRLIIDSFQPL